LRLSSLEAALAEAEASAGETDAGLGRLGDAFAELERTEERFYEAEMHRIRGEILLKRDPADTAAAEQSLQAAVAIAQSQKARSFELRAALALAKLYSAANRDADAHAVLAPAVEDFSPTQQFPELTEAQTLLSVLWESDEVMSAAALRQRRVQLQISLGNALIWAKGYHAPETIAAFARARELASREENASERFSAYYGLWVVHLQCGESASAREMAELFPREAAARPDCPEALVGHRISGVTRLQFGDFAGAHDHFQKTNELYDPARHGDFANRFGQDPRAATEIFDALALWVLGRNRRGFAASRPRPRRCRVVSACSDDIFWCLIRGIAGAHSVRPRGRRDLQPSVGRYRVPIRSFNRLRGIPSKLGKVVRRCQRVETHRDATRPSHCYGATYTLGLP